MRGRVLLAALVLALAGAQADERPAPIPYQTWANRPGNMTPPRAVIYPMQDVYYVFRERHVCPDNWAIAVVTVETDGTVSDVRFLQSSGVDKIDWIYEADLRKWQFAPATLDGKPARAEMQEVLAFGLFDHTCPNMGPIQLPDVEGAIDRRRRGDDAKPAQP